jgi:hypothetical protein
LSANCGETKVTEYLPEDDYFDHDSVVPLNVAARVTARCLARWADRYRARRLTGSDPIREGYLPGDASARETEIADVMGWLMEQVGYRVFEACLSLHHEDIWLLDAHDGFPGSLFLLPDQFAELQDCWERYGLPRDLYYPSQERRVVVEPVERYGGVFRVYQRYSPRRWANRDLAMIQAIRVPSDPERAESFIRSCEEFARRLLLRRFELSEPGRERDDDEIKALLELQRDTYAVAHRARQEQGLVSTESVTPPDRQGG